MEFVSAVFEGGLITFAAALIVYEAVRSLIRGRSSASSTSAWRSWPAPA